jgi:iron complex transport system substrate-binding protein
MKGSSCGDGLAVEQLFIPPDQEGPSMSVLRRSRPTARSVADRSATSRHPSVRTLLIGLALVLAAAGCGGAQSSSTAVPSTQPAPSSSDDPGAATDAAARFPVTVAAANGEITVDERPEAIVSLSPTATEMLFAVSAGDQVTAVDEFSTHPSEAPTTDLSGFEPNVEAIAGYDPDLVVIADDGADLSGALAELDIPVLVAPAATTLDDTYDQLGQLGAVTGHAEEAAAVVDGMREDVADITADLPDTGEPLTYFHELDDTYYTVTSDTFIGQVYEAAGLTNIADGAADDAGGYPQLSEEFIIDADPDLIFLADAQCCGQSAETVAERPGWDQITAVREGAVVELDEDVASRWGPRIVDMLRTVGDAVAEHDGG